MCWVPPNAGRGRTYAHVRGLPRCEVLQHRSSEDGLEKCGVGGQPEDRTAQGHLRATREVARRCEGRRVAGLVARGPAGVPKAKAMRISLKENIEMYAVGDLAHSDFTEPL